MNLKGYIVYRPLESERDAEIAKQYSWATQSDMKMSSFQEQLIAKGDKAAKTAGEKPSHTIQMPWSFRLKSFLHCVERQIGTNA